MRSGPGAVDRPPRAAAFTLLELLLVTTILAIVAAGAVLVIGAGTEEHAATGVAHAEGAALADAYRAFRRDTGWYPREGPFALDPAHPQVSGSHPLGRIDPADDTQWPDEAPADAAGRIAWFDNPANHYQLLVPSDPSRPGGALLRDAWAHVTGSPAVAWNAATARGFRGPYLSSRGEGWVAVLDGLAPDGTGDPTARRAGGPLAAGGVLLVPGIADPFRSAVTDAPLWRWTRGSVGAGVAVGAEPVALGRPWLYLPAGGAGRRLVCLGVNGHWESGPAGAGGDDLALALEDWR